MAQAIINGLNRLGAKRGPRVHQRGQHSHQDSDDEDGDDEEDLRPISPRRRGPARRSPSENLLSVSSIFLVPRLVSELCPAEDP